MMDILLVDDDPDVREALAGALGDEGYSVACASDGPVALRLLAAGARPSLILVDLHMPAMGGLRLGRLLAHDPTTAAISVVFLSADDHPPELPGEFLSKTAALDELLAVVERHCGPRRAQRSPKAAGDSDAKPPLGLRPIVR
jgi:CheY-like chemotaxis protein